MNGVVTKFVGGGGGGGDDNFMVICMHVHTYVLYIFKFIIKNEEKWLISFQSTYPTIVILGWPFVLAKVFYIPFSV